MKKAFLLAVAALLVFAQAATAQKGAVAAANEKNIPASVTGALMAKYPNVKVDDWDWEDDMDMYEAEFKMNGREHEAYFTPEGTWVKTKVELKKNELPQPVRTALSQGEYSTWKSGDYMEMDTPEHGKVYKVKVEKGKEEYYLKYDASGKLIDRKSKEEKKAMKHEHKH